MLIFSSKSGIFRYLLLLFIIGVALASFVFIDYYLIFLLILFSLILAGLFWPKRVWRYFFLGLVILVLGIVRYQQSLPKTDETKIWFYNNSRATFQGVVINEPDTRINQTKLIVEVRQVMLKNQPLKVKGKVLVSVSLYPEYQYGDLLSINCQLKAPEKIESFTYDRYLAKDDIYSLCSYPKIKIISLGNGDWLMTKIFIFKNKLRQLINSNLPEPQASLFFAINFGNRGGIPQELADKFSITGTTHLIAISGMNITIIAAILMQFGLACYISRKKAFWLATIILIFYVTAIGFPASAVRALIMGWLAMFALYLGRLNVATNAVVFAASLMVLINPKILRDDVGFQLSFLAIMGLIYFYPSLEKWLKKIPSTFGLRESLAMTLAAQLATMPLIVYDFGRLSLIGPIANLLVVWVLSYLVIFGFLAMFLSLILTVAAPYLFWPIWLIMTYLIKTISLFALTPYGALIF